MSRSRPHVSFTSTCHFHDYMPLSQKTTCFTKQQHGTTRHYVTLRCITWRRHTTLHESTPHYATLRYITLHHLASTHNITRSTPHYATLRSITLHCVASLGVVIQTSQAPCLCLIAKPPCWETTCSPSARQRQFFLRPPDPQTSWQSFFQQVSRC